MGGPRRIALRNRARRLCQNQQRQAHDQGKQTGHRVCHSDNPNLRELARFTLPSLADPEQHTKARLPNVMFMGVPLVSVGLNSNRKPLLPTIVLATPPPRKPPGCRKYARQPIHNAERMRLC